MSQNKETLRWKFSRVISKMLPDKLYLSIKYRNRMGYWMDWGNPRTFCEKIQVLKLRSKYHPEYTKMVDKVDAKEFVASIIGSEYIIPTLGVWDRVEEIDFDNLPGDYILKCAHDSSKGVVIKEGDIIDKPALKKRMEYYQERTYFTQNREYPYKNVPHRLIAEKFLVNGEDEELMDYKFYCFNGSARFVQIIADRSTKETIDFYDRDWGHQPFCGLNPKAVNAEKKHKAPSNYKEMFELADRLSTAINTPFVRIDLYNVNGRIYFGEITFFPSSGIGCIRPKEWDLKLGQMLHL